MTMDPDNEKSLMRPYPPIANVITLLHKLRSRNLPEKIERQYLRETVKIPEGTIRRTLFAMRFLGLVDEDNKPLEPLESIATSTDEEYQVALSGLIRSAYREVFDKVSPGEDTQDKIYNEFRRYKPPSQRDRMVAFFLGMCREAGIPTLDTPKARLMATAKTTGKKQGIKNKANIPSQRVEQVPAYFQQTTIIDPAIQGMIQSLPVPGTQLNKERREQWLTMAEAILKYVYPEVATLNVDEEETETID